MTHMVEPPSSDAVAPARRWALAARALLVPSGRSSRAARTGRVVVAAALLPLPVLLVVRAVQGSYDDVVLVATGSVLMTVLALARGALVAGTRATPAVRTAVRQAALRSTVGFLVLALLPISGLAYLAVTESSRAMEGEVRDRLSLTASVSAEYVREQISTMETLVASYASRLRLVEALQSPGSPGSQPELDRQMAGLRLQDTGLLSAWVLSPDGLMQSVQPPSPTRMDGDYRLEDYVVGALARPGPYVSTSYAPPEVPGDHRAVDVAVAVRDRQGAVLGVVAVSYLLDGVRDFSQQLSEVQGVQLTVADSLGASLGGHGGGGRLVASDPTIGAALAGRSGTTRLGAGDDAELAAFRRVDHLGWAVVASVNEADALAASSRLGARVVAAAVLLAQLLLMGLVLAFRADVRRRVVEAESVEREEHLSSVLDAAGDAYVSVDVAGRVTAWNAQAVALFGRPSAQVLGRPLADLEVPAAARALHLDGLVRVLRTDQAPGQGLRVEVDAVRADGRVFPAEVTLWTSGSEQAPSYNAFIRNVAQDKVQEQALAAAHEAALEASRLKSEFVANMSHEIRTPMNGVLGMTTLLRDTDLDPLQHDYVETVASCAESLLTVIDDILDFSKIEAGKLEVEAVDLELRPLVEDVVGLLSTSAGSRGIEVVSWIDPDLPAFVHGDPHRLRQVLNNLVGNAVKYTEQGEVVVRVQPAAQGGDRVLVSVRDTGIGVTSEQRTRLFDAFAQADASTTRKYGGTGLGLTISRQLVELMGGTLDVESTPGEGSTFFFDLPLPGVDAPAAVAPRRRCLTGVRVLVVDDNATNRTVLREYLAAWALVPTCVGDAEAALTELTGATARGVPFDAVLLDMHMPGTDGLELARRIVADPALRGTPMAVLTSTNQRGEREAAQAAGVGAYLTKPIRQAQLHERLRELLGAADDADRAAAPAPVLAAGAVGRVLVAEDNAVNQRVAAALLAQLGYEVDVAPDGLRAVELALSQRYDAVLMDCQMPELDGFAATRQIRAAGGAAGATPVIALTASALSTDEQLCRDAGMDDFLTKPLRREVLARVLLRWTSAPPPPAPVAVPVQPTGAAVDTLDQKVLSQLLGLGPAFSPVVRAYLDTTPARLDELTAAVASEDAEAVGRLAHLLAGSSSCVAAQHVSAASTELEMAVRAGGVGTVQAVALLRERHAQAATALEALLVPQDGGAHAHPGR